MQSLRKMMEQASNFNTPDAVREQLVRDLAQYPCREVTKVLAKAAVVDISVPVRRAAVMALKEINPKQAVETFIQNLNHQNPPILANVIHALGQLGFVSREQTIQAVSRFLTSRDYRVREIATRTVQRLAGAGQLGPRSTSRPRREIVGPSPAFL